MVSEDYCLIDSRIIKPHWLNVFRLRVTGWLPSNAANEAAEEGTIKLEEISGRNRIILTEYGRSLTDFDKRTQTEGNAILIASRFQCIGVSLREIRAAADPEALFLSDEDLLSEFQRKWVFKALEQEGN